MRLTLTPTAREVTPADNARVDLSVARGAGQGGGFSGDGGFEGDFGGDFGGRSAAKQALGEGHGRVELVTDGGADTGGHAAGLLAERAGLLAK